MKTGTRFGGRATAPTPPNTLRAMYALPPRSGLRRLRWQLQSPAASDPEHTSSEGKSVPHSHQALGRESRARLSRIWAAGLPRARVSGAGAGGTLGTQGSSPLSSRRRGDRGEVGHDGGGGGDRTGARHGGHADGLAECEWPAPSRRNLHMTWSLKHRLTRKLTEIAPLGTYRLGTPIFGHFSALMLWESAADFFCGFFRKK